jgi:hypothetical protein
MPDDQAFPQDQAAFPDNQGGGAFSQPTDLTFKYGDGPVRPFTPDNTTPQYSGAGGQGAWKDSRLRVAKRVPN